MVGLGASNVITASVNNEVSIAKCFYILMLETSVFAVLKIFEKLPKKSREGIYLFILTRTFHLGFAKSFFRNRFPVCFCDDLLTAKGLKGIKYLKKYRISSRL